MTCMTLHSLSPVPSEAASLDETAIAEAAADFSRRLTSLTSRVETSRVEAQETFDVVGLPRGLMSLDAM